MSIGKLPVVRRGRKILRSIENTHIDDVVFWQAGDGAVYKTAPQTAPKRVFKFLADYISACK